MGKRIIAFDLEGTIFKLQHQPLETEIPSTMWYLLANSLGKEAIKEEKQTHENWENGIYKTYREWVNHTYEIHKKYKLNKRIFNRTFKKAEYNEGVVEFFKKLDRSQWIPVIISGSFCELVNKARKDLNIDYGFGACEYEFSPITGKLCHHYYYPADFKAKISCLNSVRSEEKIDRNDENNDYGIWAYVGDGKNDVEIAKKAAVAFGINPQKELKSVCGLIEIKSFLDLLPYLNDFDKYVKAVKDEKQLKKQQTKEKARAPKKIKWSKDGIILIFGEYSPSKNDILQIAEEEYNIEPKKIEFYKGFEDNFDFNILENNPKYSYLFFGPMDHSKKGKGKCKSIYGKIANSPETYPKLYKGNDFSKPISQEDIKKFFQWIIEDKKAIESQDE